jgi:arabinose-5-phosphate isomerase
MISGRTKMENEINIIGKNVIDLQIKALRKLKSSINESFSEAVKKIDKCKSKIIICGVGKSGIIASKISATLSSVGTPSFSISASECSHGDLGRITPQDMLLLISNSGNTEELKNIIKYAKINKIILIGIVSNKKSNLYKSANIKLLIPNLEEAGYGIVPTSSTTAQLALGDALAIALMKKKKFGKLDFKKFHPAGNLANKLKTASDLMLKNNKIPFVNENEIMKNALKKLNSKKLGFLVVINNQGLNSGIFTDGDLKRLVQKKKAIDNLKIKNFITKNPYIVDKDTLATDILFQMNKRKITSACVYNKSNKKRTVGVIHIHNLLNILK